MILKDIDKQIELIDQSVDWSSKYGKDSFPKNELKEFRRHLRKISKSLDGNCSAAAYGESQVGKSYLMSSLLSSQDNPFVIRNNGKDYSFIDEINPSGGNTSKTESTGVVTRFTIRETNEKMRDFVRIQNLTISDIIQLLADAYYNDLKVKSDSALSSEDINKELNRLSSLWEGKSSSAQCFLVEDDVLDILDYIKDVIGISANGVIKSDFGKVVSQNIAYVAINDWPVVFELLWNRNKEITRLFKVLIRAYQAIGFNQEVYVPFDAVLREKGTLLSIEWLNDIMDENIASSSDDKHFTSVYDKDGKCLQQKLHKTFLSALIAELSFSLPEELAEERSFLNELDLLDFPGARSREKIDEDEIGKMLPALLRRGKVAYLFNNYSRSLKISAVLFTHHNDQKNEPTLGDTIHSWIKNNIGEDQKQRSEYLKGTNGKSPLFLIATKFNIEMERTKLDTPDNLKSLGDHWRRFTTVFPEIIKPSAWFDKWVFESSDFKSESFQHIYLLRDFYWSEKNRVFTGYSEGANASPEKSLYEHKDYPDFYDQLRKSFLEHEFVQQHFANPEKSWNDVAQPNSDGSKAIIEDLNAISGVLLNARKVRYLRELKKIQNRMIEIFAPYYEPEDIRHRTKRIFI